MLQKPHNRLQLMINISVFDTQYQLLFQLPKHFIKGVDIKTIRDCIIDLFKNLESFDSFLL